MDVNQYLEIFLDETKEHLQNLNTQILELEADSENMDTIDEIFRAAHSLKGMAGTMGYKRMQALTHEMESVFSEFRNGHIKVQPSTIDIVFQCLDALEEYMTNIQDTADEGTKDNEILIKQLQAILNGEDGGEEGSQESSGSSDSAADSADSGEMEEFEEVDSPDWLHITLDSTQVKVIQEAGKQGQNIYGVKVTVQETCILKAARAFLVFKAIEELGEIIVSNPSAHDLEDERFEDEFSLIVITEVSLDEVLAAAGNVSEIKEVTGDVLHLHKMKNVDKDEQDDESIMTEVSGQVSQGSSQSGPLQGGGTYLGKAAESTQPQRGGAPAVGGAAGDKKYSQGKPVVNRTVRVDIEKLDVLMNLVSELIIAKNSLISASNKDKEQSINSEVNEQIEYLESVTTNLHESVMKVRMVPIESVVSKFPRMIRDLSRSLGKKMDLFMSGEETELDRTVVDEIGDPLMHLLRNAADHGLESTQVRIGKGKPETGSIFLDAYQDGNNVVIEVRDDGNGIDVERVREKAIERGTITPDQAVNMTDKEVIELLFLPAFSMAKEITDVSGRGVGLDVVKSKIEALSGEIEVKTRLGEGSTWIIRLPLTLAIIQALMVVVGKEKYAISLGSIQTIEDIPFGEVKLVQNKEVIHLRGNVIPLIRLSEVLDIEVDDKGEENLIVVIVKKGDKQAGLVVNELIGQQEIVIKSLGKYIRQCKFISGATILGDGEVALILDTNSLI